MWIKECLAQAIIATQHSLVYSHKGVFPSELWYQIWSQRVNNDASQTSDSIFSTCDLDLLHPIAVGQCAFTVTCTSQVRLKFVARFLRNLAERDFLTYVSFV